MIGSFQRPNSLALCIFSVLWIVVSVWFGSTFVLAGKLLSGAGMGVFGLAALGLWFQSRVAAWVLISFACLGIVFALLKIGHAPVLRIITPIAWAAWSITLLAEFLKEQQSP